MQIKGKVHKYGNDVDTDVIIPARYLNTSSERELASHCMEDIDKAFVQNVKAGDLIVAEDNFLARARAHRHKGERDLPCHRKFVCAHFLP